MWIPNKHTSAGDGTVKKYIFIEKKPNQNQIKLNQKGLNTSFSGNVFRVEWLLKNVIRSKL